MFNNLQNDFDFNGKISVSSLLGFNNIENVNYLHRLVLSHYPNLENNDTNTLSINEAISPSQSSSSIINPLDKIIITPTSSSSAIVCAKENNERIERACKRQALTTLSSSSGEVQHGIYVQPEGIDMNPQSTQALLVKYQSTKNEIYS